MAAMPTVCSGVSGSLLPREDGRASDLHYMQGSSRPNPNPKREGAREPLFSSAPIAQSVSTMLRYVSMDGPAEPA